MDNKDKMDRMNKRDKMDKKDKMDKADRMDKTDKTDKMDKTDMSGRTGSSGIPRQSISPETDEILQRIDSEQRIGRTRKSRNVLSNLMIIAGVALIVLPLVLTFVNMKRNADAMNAFLDDTEWVVDDAHASVEDVDSFYQQDVDFQDIAQADGALDPAIEASLPPSVEMAPLDLEPQTPSPADVPSTEAAPESAKKPLMSKEEIQKRMIGVLYIDKIEVRIPVMTGVDDETLRVAAGRMPESGKLDEIGNAVLAGHRSYTFGKYFNRLDELEPGDTFYIKTGKKTLEYTIFKKFIVEPDDFSILNYNKTDKICTLFTCHPVVIANKRLVVQALQTN